MIKNLWTKLKNKVRNGLSVFLRVPKTPIKAVTRIKLEEGDTLIVFYKASENKTQVAEVIRGLRDIFETTNIHALPDTYRFTKVKDL